MLRVEGESQDVGTLCQGKRRLCRAFSWKKAENWAKMVWNSKFVKCVWIESPPKTDGSFVSYGWPLSKTDAIDGNTVGKLHKLNAISVNFHENLLQTRRNRLYSSSLRSASYPGTKNPKVPTS